MILQSLRRIGFWCGCTLLIFTTTTAAADSTTPPGKPSFDTTGAQVGQQLPNVPLRTLDNEPTSLGYIVHGDPALILTSSLTCPKSRSTYPDAAALAAKYKNLRFDIIIVYIIEAHPYEDPSPYSGHEDVTEENKRDGILRHQPKTLEKRLEMANDFQKLMKAKIPIYVDAMDNAAWKSLGGGPNMAILVGDDGIVQARQGWFTASAMGADIDREIAKARQLADADASDPSKPSNRNAAFLARIEADGLGRYDFDDPFRDGNVAQAAKFLDRHPEAVHYIADYEQRGDTGGESLLQLAAANDRPAIIDLLLDRGADINAQTVWKAAALQLAAKAGHKDVVDLLLHHAADVNLHASNGPTALQEALYSDNAEIVALLAKAGAKDNFFTDVARGNLEAIKKAIASDPTIAYRPDGASRTPLMYAAAAGQMESAKLLLAASAPITEPEGSMDEMPLDMAVRRKHYDMVTFLLDAHADPEARLYDEGTALNIAAGAGDAPSVKILLAHKAKINAVDIYAQTPLHNAAAAGNVETATLLLDAGADINAVTGKFELPCGPGEENHANTPFLLAAESCNVEMMQFLKSRGANVTICNAQGQNALDMAVSGWTDNKRGPAVTMLLALGYDLAAKDKKGDTALHIAAQCGDVDSIKLLLAAKANVNAVNDNGEMPIHVATKVEAVKKLLDAGADVNRKTTNSVGNTPFLLAAQNQSVELMKYLVSRGANVDAVNADGHTALGLAESGAGFYSDKDHKAAMDYLWSLETNKKTNAPPTGN